MSLKLILSTSKYVCYKVISHFAKLFFVHNFLCMVKLYVRNYRSSTVSSDCLRMSL